VAGAAAAQRWLVGELMLSSNLYTKSRLGAERTLTLRVFPLRAGSPVGNE